MNRRAYLGATVATGVAAAGCLGDSDGEDATVLDPPEDHPSDPEAMAYPAHGQELPGATVPSPLHDREVSTTEYAGVREVLVTFVYTRCPDVCSPLTANLARAQTRAADEGYADELALLPITFDPEHDTEPVLREFSAARGADPDAENWQFLRPESPERAADVVTGTFGVPFRKESGAGGEGDDDQERTDNESAGGLQSHDYDDHEHQHDGGNATDDNDHDGGNATDDSDHDHDGGVEFSHRSLTLLANREGYVERAYTGNAPRPDVVLDDLEAVREGFR